MIDKSIRHQIYAFIVCFLFLDCFFPMYASYIAKTTGHETNNIVYQILAALLYLIAGLSVLNSFGWYRRASKYLGELIFLMIFALISMTWSIERGTTLKSAVALIGTILVAVSLLKNVPFREFMKVLMFTFLAANVGSIVFCIFFPNMSIHDAFPHEGLWKGLYSHKNIMARNVSLSIIVSILFYFEYSRKRIKDLIVLFLSLSLSGILLINSGGKSGLIISVFLMGGVYPLLLFLRSANSSIIRLVNAIYFGGMTFLFALGYVFYNLDSILGTIGGNLTLSGRTFLWVLTVPFIFSKILIGYGFDAFWESSHAVNMGLALRWQSPPPHAHNAFFDLLLNFGVIGGGLFVYLFLKTLFRLVRNLFKTRKILNLFILFFYLSIYTIPGSLILSQNSMSLIIFIYIIYNIRRQEDYESKNQGIIG